MQLSDETSPPTPNVQSGERDGSSRLTRIVLRLVVVAAALVALVYFVAANFVIVEVRLFGLHQPVRLAWVILFTFLAGGLVGAAMVALRGRLRRR
jgi:uncharacterized integral membrane protein